MFEQAKVGDRVYRYPEGLWGTIVRIDNDTPYPIIVVFDNDPQKIKINFALNGNFYKDDVGPNIFWDEVKITPPPRPRRKVKKKLTGWVNIYINDTEAKENENYYKIGNKHIYNTVTEAWEARGIDALGSPVKVEHEWEEEE